MSQPPGPSITRQTYYIQLVDLIASPSTTSLTDSPLAEKSFTAPTDPKRAIESLTFPTNLAPTTERNPPEFDKQILLELADVIASSSVDSWSWLVEKLFLAPTFVAAAGVLRMLIRARVGDALTFFGPNRIFAAFGLAFLRLSADSADPSSSQAKYQLLIDALHAAVTQQSIPRTHESPFPSHTSKSNLQQLSQVPQSSPAASQPSVVPLQTSTQPTSSRPSGANSAALALSSMSTLARLPISSKQHGTTSSTPCATPARLPTSAATVSTTTSSWHASARPDRVALEQRHASRVPG